MTDDDKALCERLRSGNLDQQAALADEAADRIEALSDEIDTWRSVFPDIAPESVMRDRSLVEEENKRLREVLGEIACNNGYEWSVLCSSICQSVRKEGEQWQHHPLCQKARAALDGKET